MMQTAIPCLLFASDSSQLRLLGGTNADFAPEIDYYSMVYGWLERRQTRPSFAKLDLSTHCTEVQFQFRFDCRSPVSHRRVSVKRWMNDGLLHRSSSGYYPRGGGEVRITVNPVDHLSAVDLTDFGEIKRFFGRAFVAGTLPKRVRTHPSNPTIRFLHPILDGA